ncbi:MAG TPA: hypothetical protein VFQ53_31225 [Kofleriaceae bacterium]|nr:hypothetical protein [Kofleriaceae bacterium]
MRLAIAFVLALAATANAQRQPGWEVRIPERTELAIGTSAVVPITIAVDRGLTVSKDGPVIVDLAAEPGITIKKRRLGRGDAVDREADAPRFEVAVRGDAAGDHVVKVRIRMWICGQKLCRPADVRRQVTIAVTPSAGSDAAR